MTRIVAPANLAFRDQPDPLALFENTLAAPLGKSRSRKMPASEAPAP